MRADLWTATNVLLHAIGVVVFLVQGQAKLSLWLRLVIALVAGVAAAGVGFGMVALVFLVTRHDPGIGGGLIALGMGIVSALVAAMSTFLRLSSRE